MALQAIKYDTGKLEILDQLLLPKESKYISIKGVEDGWRAIHNMQVRGAPAIAIVGCLSLVVDIYNEEFEKKKVLRQEVEGKLNYLVSARPTAVNMKLAADDLLNMANDLAKDENISVSEMKNRFIKAVEEMLEKDVADNSAIGQHGATAILNQDNVRNGNVRVLTHCNTGSLATSGYGTALGVCRSLAFHKRLGRSWTMVRITAVINSLANFQLKISLNGMKMDFFNH
ncbi:unnamed protein product [Bemisia tabaci]|uniref:Methylthioribose-1-phosphate isomerase n=1 Tax=Bemisia tabaci TaxID=7038 RepID=A0A9P0F9T6_BEMTA|nr:unnamed protein product [Bemisia tabaci]